MSLLLNEIYSKYVFSHVSKPEQLTKMTSFDVVTNSTPFSASTLIATEAVVRETEYDCSIASIYKN